MFQQFTAPNSLMITCILEAKKLPIPPMHDAYGKLDRDFSRGGHTFFLNGFFPLVFFHGNRCPNFYFFKCTFSAQFDLIEC